MTGTLMGSSQSVLGEIWYPGVTGVLTGLCRKTATGLPKPGLARGEVSSLLGRLPDLLREGRGLGWFLPGRVLGLVPGDLRGKRAQRRSWCRRFMVESARGSISVERAHR